MLGGTERMRTWGPLSGILLAVLLTSVGTAWVLPSVWRTPDVDTVESFMGTLLGATASALGVVFVFVFVVVEAARSERRSASGSASYTAVLRKTGATTALLWSLLTLFLVGAALVAATAEASGTAASRATVALGVAGTFSATVALVAVGWERGSHAEEPVSWSTRRSTGRRSPEVRGRGRRS